MSADAGLLLVLTTVASQEQARALASTMLAQHLTACVQLQPIESLYRWNGQVQQETEWRVLFKTTAARYPALQAALHQAHPYELPAIVAVPVAQALPAFADWVAQESEPSQP